MAEVPVRIDKPANCKVQLPGSDIVKTGLAISGLYLTARRRHYRTFLPAAALPIDGLTYRPTKLESMAFSSWLTVSEVDVAQVPDMPGALAVVDGFIKGIFALDYYFDHPPTQGRMTLSAAKGLNLPDSFGGMTTLKDYDRLLLAGLRRLNRGGVITASEAGEILESVATLRREAMLIYEGKQGRSYNDGYEAVYRIKQQTTGRLAEICSKICALVVGTAGNLEIDKRHELYVAASMGLQFADDRIDWFKDLMAVLKAGRPEANESLLLSTVQENQKEWDRMKSAVGEWQSTPYRRVELFRRNLFLWRFASQSLDVFGKRFEQHLNTFPKIKKSDEMRGVTSFILKWSASLWPDSRGVED